MKRIIRLLTSFVSCLLVTVCAQPIVSQTAAGKNDPITGTAVDNQQLQKEAALTAAFLTRKYEGDANLEKSLTRFYYSRSMELKKAWADYHGTDQLDKQITSILQRYDSVENKMLFVVKGNVFLNKQLAALNAIKPLSAKDIHALQTAFLRLCRENTDKSYADYFNDVLHFIVKDTTYYAVLYKGEIQQQSRFNAIQGVNVLAHKYQVTKEAMKEIALLINSKERSVSVINYAFPTYTGYKDSLMKKAVNYYDSLISLALKRDGTFAYTSKFSIAIKNRLSLNLRSGQVDTLLERAYALEKMQAEFMVKNPLGKFDGAPFEAEHITALLSEDQYLKLLGIINRPQAEKWSYGDWDELVKRGMSAELDSAKTVREFLLYNISRLVARDRYADDKIRQNAEIKVVDNNMPAALRRLKSVRRRPETTEKAAETPVPGTIKW
ncbi:MULTISPECIES: hypothetical protein [Niastella]|uniref:Uncharacterized protein n=1 Tax=Niastella soli TaxID=2821487 RepID=A0ABS3Z5G0_9BACT|nr:hypothetical protein [Niastella soli]MBO9205401.1 hypothetical protein [Niastella soli]